MTPKDVFVHALAICDSKDVGRGTRIWPFAHVMEGARLGEDCNVGESAFIESGAYVGDRVTIKNGALIWDKVTIEDDAFIGPGTVFTNDLTPRSDHKTPHEEFLPTVVERGASIGANATIICGVTIGSYAMVGAGAVVAGDVEPYALVVGDTARQVAWACVCGEPLGDELRCSCGRSYRESGSPPTLTLITTSD